MTRILPVAITTLLTLHFVSTGWTAIADAGPPEDAREPAPAAPTLRLPRTFIPTLYRARLAVAPNSPELPWRDRD